jgi:outer membrane immunogenic protein
MPGAISIRPRGGSGTAMRIASLLNVAVCIGAMMTSAQAEVPAAQPVPKAPSADAPRLLTWAGFYIGGHVGEAWSNAGWTTPVSETNTDSISTALLGGAQVGYNSQFGSNVLGIEGDFSGSSLQSSNVGAAGFTNTTSTHWTSSVTGRLGKAYDSVLLYAKAGLAIADARDSVTSPLGTLSSSTGTTTQAGWTMGGGLEYALDPHWSVKAEYDYLGFGSLSVPAAASGGTPGSVGLNIQRAIGGVNYRF